MGGGDLLNLLIEWDVFEEDFTRIYAAEVSRYRPFSRLCPEIPTLLALNGARRRSLPQAWVHSQRYKTRCKDSCNSIGRPG